MKILDLLKDKKLKSINDLMLFLTSSYILIKKICGFSLTNDLLKDRFHFTAFAVDFTVYLLLCAILVSALFKAISYITEGFEKKKFGENIDPENIIYCLVNFNKEIQEHLGLLNNKHDHHIKLSDLHKFGQNIGMIIKGLSEQICHSFQDFDLKRKDVFISLYDYNHDSKQLVYSVHHPVGKDRIKSLSINVDADEYKNYECIKCLKSYNMTTTKLKKQDYHKGHERRYKTMQHYMGVKIIVNDNVAAFLNIEIHNKKIFDSEEQISSFIESNIITFKLLIEYQYLRRNLLQQFPTYQPNTSNA